MKWKSVRDDGLPPKGEYVLAWCNNGAIRILRTIDFYGKDMLVWEEQNVNDDDEVWFLSEVSHWMDLSELPKP